MRILYGWLIGLTLLIAGCGTGTGDDEVDGLSVVSIEITPGNATTTSGKTVTPVQLSARVTWNNGEVIENAQVSWASSNAIAGSITQSGLFTPAEAQGGVTLITAGYLGQKGTTALTVVFTQDVLEDNLPSSLPALVDAAEKVVDDANAPLVLYPQDNVTLPRNLPGLEFQWEKVDARPLHVLEFKSATTFTRIFTTSDRWHPPREVWSPIVATNSGGEITLYAQSAAVSGDGESLTIEGPLYSPSAPVRLNISRLDSTGSIYYWEQRDNSYLSIKRIFYKPGSEEMQVQTFYAPRRVPENSGGEPVAQCIGCHSVSPQGDRMSVTYSSSDISSTINVLDLPLDEDDPTPEVNEVVEPSGYPVSNRGAFTADGKYLVGVDFGEATLFDAHTLEYIQPIDLGFERVENFNFSPDGEEVVFTVPGSNNYLGDISFNDGRIAAAPYNDGDFGDPYWVTPELSGVNRYYPVYSPDGNWIVFTQSTCGGQPPSPDCDSYMDPTAELYLVARGGGEPIRLDSINDYEPPVAEGEQPEETPPPGQPTPPPGQPTPTPGPEPDLTQLRLANSGPGWGPLPDADLLWLTFSSIRGYGHYVRYGLEVPQIYVSAIDPEKAAAGVDPSSPPYWLPYQDTTAHNHIPQWGVY